MWKSKHVVPSEPELVTKTNVSENLIQKFTLKFGDKNSRVDVEVKNGVVSELKLNITRKHYGSAAYDGITIDLLRDIGIDDLMFVLSNLQVQLEEFVYEQPESGWKGR